jgi:hypothetical protein
MGPGTRSRAAGAPSRPQPRVKVVGFTSGAKRQEDRPPRGAGGPAAGGPAHSLLAEQLARPAFRSDSGSEEPQQPWSDDDEPWSDEDDDTGLLALGAPDRGAAARRGLRVPAPRCAAPGMRALAGGCCWAPRRRPVLGVGAAAAAPRRARTTRPRSPPRPTPAPAPTPPPPPPRDPTHYAMMVYARAVLNARLWAAQA